MPKRDLENEKDTEAYLVEQVQDKLEGIAYKFTSANRRNVPDRLCILPEGVHFFVEVKSEGKNPNGGQIREIIRLQELQHPVWVARTKREVDKIVDIVIKTNMERSVSVHPKKDTGLIIIP